MAEELKEYEFIVSEESEGERVDKYLTMLMDSLSRSYLQKLLKESHDSDIINYLHMRIRVC